MECRGPGYLFLGLMHIISSYSHCFFAVILYYCCDFVNNICYNGYTSGWVDIICLRLKKRWPRPLHSILLSVYLTYFLHNVFPLICVGPRKDMNKRPNSNMRRIFRYPCWNKRRPLICSSLVISAASPYATLVRNITVIYR